MIDIHAHYIPDWDDGPKSLDVSLQMCERAVADGITDVILTPHLYRVTRHGDNLDLLSSRFTEFVGEAQSSGLRFHRGNEILIVHNLVDVVKSSPEVRLANSCYVLVELPEGSVPPGIGEMFYKLQLEGFTPVIAHPERNAVFQEHPEELFELISHGALTQVTAQSITGQFGHRARKSVEHFLRNKWVHVIASDAHSVNSREPLLSKGRAAAAEIVGEEIARILVVDAPNSILRDQAMPDIGDPIPVKTSNRFSVRLPSLFRSRKEEEPTQDE